MHYGRQPQLTGGLGVHGGKGVRQGSLSGLREGVTQQDAKKGYPSAICFNQQRGMSSLGAESWHDPIGTGGWDASAIPDLIELSPPRPDVPSQGKGCQGSVPWSATPNQAWPHVSAPSFADLLRGYDVDESTGLRGVQLAHPRKERDPFPVIHMPDREYGGGNEQGPPPSLDLPGLDPVPVQRGLQESVGRPVPPLALGPCMPGAMTPFVATGRSVEDRSVPPPPVPVGLFESPPPMPVGPFEPPRSTVNTARSAYTPGRDKGS